MLKSLLRRSAVSPRGIRWWGVGLLALAGGSLLGAANASALTVTPSTTEGPYYTMSSANQVTTPGNSLFDGHFFTTEGLDNDLTHIASTGSLSNGSVYLLSGTLVNTSGTAIPGATIELWEADNGGIYWYNSSSSGTNSYTSRDQKFQGFGRTVTDNTGAWSFRAIKPGLYTGRIRHFHFKVNINGVSVLTSQFMFSEDSGSFSSDNVAAPLVQAGTMSYVTLTTTSGTDTSGNAVLIGSKQIVVNYSGVITGAPTVTSQPTSVVTTTGNSATFTVAANGTGTLSYQWYKGTSLSNGSTISGATGASYTVASVSSSSVGGYYCIVKNTVGSTVAAVESNPAALTIGTSTSTAPTITTQPASQSVASGSSVTFSIAASNATAYQWYKGTVGSGATISGATSSSYTISGATSSSAGTYYVVVSNASGSTTSAGATLTVTTTVSAPTITTQPASQTVTAGSSATFSVVASGSGTLSYQWYKGTAALSGATGASYTIASTTTSDAGSYSVKVANSGGTTTSATATLTVNAAANAPTITTQPASQSVLAGNSASFTVAAGGTAPLTYQWYFGGSAINGATGATYTLTTVSMSNAGSYTVKVSNAAGSATSNAAILSVSEPYAAFVGNYGLNATTGAPGADPDSDGIPNGLEFLLGGSPISGDADILPTSTYQLVNGAPALVYRFNLAVPVGGTTWAVEYSDSMSVTAWTTAVQGVNGVTMSMDGTATTTLAGRTVYPVTVVIPTSATQLYARLRVTPAQ